MNPTRRVVTGHDAVGKSIVVMDSPAPNVKERKASHLVSTLIWVTYETPADISGSADRAEREIGVPPPAGGSIFRIVDFPPFDDEGAPLDNQAILREMGVAASGAKARHPLMHRTRSIDYMVVISGEIYLLHDDSEVLLRAGDVIVQRGTNHSWENRSKENCRIAVVLIDAKEPARP